MNDLEVLGLSVILENHVPAPTAIAKDIASFAGCQCGWRQTPGKGLFRLQWSMHVAQLVGDVAKGNSTESRQGG